MAAKKYDIEVSHTLELIHNFWPDFPISKENFENPTSDFVIRFYNNFVAEFNEKLSFIGNEEVTSGECVENQEFGQEVQLYCQIAKIYKRLNYTFNLTDLYSPQSKRTHALIKTAIHFLVFVNNDLDVISNNASAIYKKFTDTRDLKSLKQQTLQDTAENSENLARLEDINAELKTKLETIKATKYEKMLRDKAEREKIYLEKTLEKKHLESEIANLDYELQHLQGKEDQLRQRLVTEEDFQNLKKREKYFEREAEQMCSEDCDVDGDVNKKTEMSEYLRECAKNLEGLRFNSIQVNALRGLREETKLQQDMLEKYRNQKALLEDVAAAKVAKVDKKIQKLKEMRTLYSQLQSEAAEDAEKGKLYYQSKIDEYTRLFKEAQKLKTDCKLLQEKISKTEEARRKFMEEALKYCQIMVTADENTAAKFNDTLLHLKNLFKE